jgi:hypothetical protein
MRPLAAAKPHGPESRRGKWDSVISGRLLILKTGPDDHWSHYGPLEPCRALLEAQ